MGEDSNTNKGFRRFLKLAIFYLLFVVINIGLNRLCGLLHLPLFLDNVGTLLAAALGGYVPGIIVGYSSNIFNSAFDPANAYYAVLSVLIAVTGRFFYDKGYFDKFHKAIITIPVFALIGGVFGSLLTYFMYGFGIGEGISAPFAQSLLASGKLNVFWAQMISDVVIDLVDKAITVVIVFVIIKLVPYKFASALALVDWRQRPLNKDEIKEVNKTEIRKAPLRTKLVMTIGIMMVFVAIVTTSISYLLYQRFAVTQYTYTAKNIASVVAATVDGDRVDDYFVEGTGSADYADTMNKLRKIYESSPNIKYIYVYKIEPDGCYVVFDLDTEEMEGGKLGDFVPFDESFLDKVPLLLSGQEIEPVISNDTFGWLLTDYEPVYNSNHKCVCYAAADISMDEVISNGISFLAKVLSLFLGFFIMIIVFAMWHMQYHLTYPIDAMTYVARNFAYNSDEEMDTGVERLKDLKIITGDEIENLYESLSKTFGETVGYLEDVKNKSEEINKMQKGLIYIMADLVESRDKSTGDHIRKTTAYVNLILAKLKEKGEFKDVLTDEYIYEVSNSSPLHDVGKIKVSDLILNKPGRLDDEEFKKMQIHTIEGEKIIENAMKISSTSDYLKEAKNIAAYHHEKWDGTGYPYGLKGEDIPLSARIMAVSDVFDALISARVYKPAMKFEDAMRIIKEGSGKHFDPVIVSAFVDAEEEVKKIAEEHKKIFES
ncbi:MAG: HD domain-containing protein [Lachnospiraceae bacterium]|nr:HD domain-containing protein [Lachnospiraceae bacterium]